MMVMIKFATASTDSCSKLSETITIAITITITPQRLQSQNMLQNIPKIFQKVMPGNLCTIAMFLTTHGRAISISRLAGWILQRGRKRIAFRAEEFATEKRDFELSWENQRQIPPCCESKSFSGAFPPDIPWRVQIAPYRMCFPILYVFPCVSRISVLPYWMQHGRLIQSSEWQCHFEKSKECWWKYWNRNKVADHPTQLIWILDVHLLSQPDQFKTYSRAIF